MNDKKSIEKVKTEIDLKQASDKKKIKSLFKLSVFTLTIRVLLLLLPNTNEGLWVDFLWLPSILLLLALPFYGFEKLLNWLKGYFE